MAIPSDSRRGRKGCACKSIAPIDDYWGEALVPSQWHNLLTSPPPPLTGLIGSDSPKRVFHLHLANSLIRTRRTLGSTSPQVLSKLHLSDGNGAAVGLSEAVRGHSMQVPEWIRFTHEKDGRSYCSHLPDWSGLDGLAFIPTNPVRLFLVELYACWASRAVQRV